jgi:hypothetical protein
MEVIKKEPFTEFPFLISLNIGANSIQDKSRFYMGSGFLQSPIIVDHHAIQAVEVTFFEITKHLVDHILVKRLFRNGFHIGNATFFGIVVITIERKGSIEATTHNAQVGGELVSVASVVGIVHFDSPLLVCCLVSFCYHIVEKVKNPNIINPYH